jgi:hypothetical protein
MNILVQADTKIYVDKLRRLGGTALPDAIADALNEPARLIAIHAKANVKKKVIVRRTYTTNSVRQFGVARGKNIRRMYSLVGSNSDYLWKQDKGMRVKAKKKKIPIPIPNARGGNMNRSILKRYAMNQIGNLDGKGGRYFAGRARGMNRPVGIYERTHGNRKLKMLRNLESSSVKIPATNWYTEAFRRYGTEKIMADAFIRSAKLKLGTMK